MWQASLFRIMMPNEKEWRSCPIFGEVKVSRCKKLLGALGNGGCAGCFPIQNMIWSSGPSASKGSVYWVRYHKGQVSRKGYNSLRIQSMAYLHAFGYARSQSVRPCYLRSDHDFCMHFRQFIFRLISDKFRQSMGNSRWPCHGLSRSVTAFSDNAQDLSIVFCLLSRFVTVCHGLSRNMLGNLKPIWTFFR